MTEEPARQGQAKKQTGQSRASQSRTGRREANPGEVGRGKVGIRAAAQILAERDPVLARLVAEAGLPSLPRPTETHFATLVRSITYQQLAGPAARAIHGRLIQAMDGEVTPGAAAEPAARGAPRRRDVGQQGRLGPGPGHQGPRRHRGARTPGAWPGRAMRRSWPG